MHTFFLSDLEVKAYLSDLIRRLRALGELMPRTWCPIGPSGVRLAQVAMQVAPELAAEIRHMPVAFDRASGAISFPGEADPAQVVKGNRVLLFDDSINSGGTITKAYRAIDALQASEISSYSLIVRRRASFLPSFFGIVIGNHDRVYLPRDEIPNNRLPPFGCVRELSQQDLNRPMVRTGKDFVDKFTWSDLMYETRVDPRRRTYLYERNGLVQAFITFRRDAGRTLLVDTLGVGAQYQRQGIAGHLLRWAETYGRHTDCRAVRLWSVEDRRDFYQKRGFESLRQQMILDGVRFFLMGKKLLYSLPDEDIAP